MKKIISQYTLFTGVLLASLVIFSLFVNIANAEYYNNYSYLGSYGNYTYANNYSVSPSYSGLNYTSTYYGQSCPSGFNLGLQNGIYVCYKFLNNNYNYSNYNTMGYNNYYNNSSYGLISGCLPGYIYSSTTGQRCDSFSYYDDYYNYDNGDINNFNVRNGSDTDLKEGDRNREIIKIRFDVSDGDIELNKVKFNFEFRGNSYYNEDLPWNIFDEVRLFSDGEEIENMDTDNKSDWDKEDDDVYSITFTNLNETIREDDRADLTLEVDINSNISGINNSNILWDVFIPDKGIKARNENGDTIYTGDDGESISIEIDQ